MLLTIDPDVVSMSPKTTLTPLMNETGVAVGEVPAPQLTSVPLVDQLGVVSPFHWIVSTEVYVRSICFWAVLLINSKLVNGPAGRVPKLNVAPSLNVSVCEPLPVALRFVPV